jgi:hypothetical protein
MSPWLRRGNAGGGQRGVVGYHVWPTTPAMACGHGIPSSAEEGSFGILRTLWTYVVMFNRYKAQAF